MSSNPVCANEVRIALALCYQKLGRERLARAWFQRGKAERLVADLLHLIACVCSLGSRSRER